MLRWRIATAAGVAAAVLATGIALVVETGRIQRDIGARVATALSGEDTSWASFAIEGRDLTLSGAAPDEDFRAEAARIAGLVPGVRTVDASAATLIPEQQPYTVTLTRGEGRLLVGGYAPSEPDRRRLVTAITAALPDLATADALSLARGMPDAAFRDALATLVPVVSDLETGRVMLRDRVASVTGEARSNEAYDRLRQLKLDLPPGYSLNPPEVTRPLASPFRLSAVRENGAVTLSGFAPDPETRSSLAAVAESGAAGAPLTVTVDLASGEPPGFRPAAIAALDFLDLFADARIDITGDRIALAGTAASPEAYRTLNSHLAAFQPDGFVVEANVELPVVSPYTLSGTRSGPKVTVSGFAPGPSVADEIRRAAEAVAGLRGAVVETTLAGGAPPQFQAAAVFAVRLLDHLSDGSVILADQRITLRGTAASSGDLLEIDASIALEAPEGYSVESVVLPPVVSPYIWSLERTEDSMVLSGYVPNEAARVAVRDAADDEAGDLAVTDRTALAEGLPDGIDLADVARFAAAEVAKLDEGRASLSDRSLSIVGATADALAARSIIDAFENALPAGLVRGTVDIDAPAPFAFRVERRADRLVVAGGVPDEAARDRLAAAVQRMFGAMPVDLTLTPTRNIGNGAEAAALQALRAASLMREGTATIEDASVHVEGTALTPGAVERLDTDVIASMPPGFVARANVQAPEPPEPLGLAACQERLDATLSRVEPRFSDADIIPESEGALLEIAAAALACGDVRLVVEVRAADTVPADPVLAEGRGLALLEALVDAGVPAAMLSLADGEGATRPAAEALPASDRHVMVRAEPTDR